MIKNLPAMQEIHVQFLSWEDPLEKGMATHSSILFFCLFFFHSSILAWKIPWSGEPGGLCSSVRDQTCVPYIASAVS